jgi:hypothetical protein
MQARHPVEGRPSMAGHIVNRTSETLPSACLTEVDTVDVLRFTAADARYRRERP